LDLLRAGRENRLIELIPFRGGRVWNLFKKFGDAFAGRPGGALFPIMFCHESREALGQGDGHERVHGQIF